MIYYQLLCINLENFEASSKRMEPEKGPELKRRKIHKPPPRRTAPSPSSKTPKDAKSTSNLTVPRVQLQTSDITSFRIQQDKNFAVAQAQQDGCTGNFKKFDSPYGNFLVPVVPSRAELNG